MSAYEPGDEDSHYEDDHENADRPNGCLALQALTGTMVFGLLMAIFW